MVGQHNGQPVQIATYRDKTGKHCAQKIRSKDKKFSIVGDAKAMTLYGSHLFSKGRKLVVCEGEIDCISISQIQGHKWATTSLVNGCQSAKKTLLANYDYLMGFKEIILFFDNDAPGRAAAIECAEALPIGLADVIRFGVRSACR
jgi:twinkle protein